MELRRTFSRIEPMCSTRKIKIISLFLSRKSKKRGRQSKKTIKGVERRSSFRLYLIRRIKWLLLVNLPRKFPKRATGQPKKSHNLLPGPISRLLKRFQIIKVASLLKYTVGFIKWLSHLAWLKNSVIFKSKKMYNTFGMIANREMKVLLG